MPIASRPIVLAAIPDRSGLAREMLRGVIAYEQQHGPWELIDSVRSNRSSPEAIRADGRQADAIIAASEGPRDAGFRRSLRRFSRPVVIIGGHEADPALPSVVEDTAGIGGRLVSHMADMGLQRLAFYPRPEGYKARYQAFVAALSRAGLDELPSYDAQPDNSRRGAWRRTARWLSSLGRPVGVVTPTVEPARDLCMACQIAGLDIPEDVAVITVCSDEMRCELASPSLTSVDSGGFHMGYQGAAMLHELLQGRQPVPFRLAVPPGDLIVRRSTDVLAVDDAHVAQALRYIRDYALEDIGVDDVCGELAISRRSLERRFRKAMHRTMHDEITRVRLARAAQLLRTSPLPVIDVATRCGYSSKQQFHQQFKRFYGTTPARFRKQSVVRP